MHKRQYQQGFQQYKAGTTEKKLKLFLVEIVQNVLLPRRDGRAVECGGLENR